MDLAHKPNTTLLWSVSSGIQGSPHGQEERDRGPTGSAGNKLISSSGQLLQLAPGGQLCVARGVRLPIWCITKLKPLPHQVLGSPQVVPVSLGANADLRHPVGKYIHALVPRLALNRAHTMSLSKDLSSAPEHKYFWCLHPKIAGRQSSLVSPKLKN